MKDTGTVPPLFNQVINCYTHYMNIGIYYLQILYTLVVNIHIT